MEGNIFADEATCWWDGLIVLFGSNASELSCFLLVATAVSFCFMSCEGLRRRGVGGDLAS